MFVQKSCCTNINHLQGSSFLRLLLLTSHSSHQECMTFLKANQEMYTGTTGQTEVPGWWGPCPASPREAPVAPWPWEPLALAAPWQCSSVGYELVKESQCPLSFSLPVKDWGLWSYGQLPLDCQGRILKAIVKPILLCCGLAIENTPHTRGLSKLPSPNSLLTSLHEGRMSETN